MAEELEKIAEMPETPEARSKSNPPEFEKLMMSMMASAMMTPLSMIPMFMFMPMMYMTSAVMPSMLNLFTSLTGFFIRPSTTKLSVPTTPTEMPQFPELEPVVEKLGNIFDVRSAELYDVPELEPQTLTLDTLQEGKRILEVFAIADAPTTFLLEASQDNEHWFPVKKWEKVTEIHEVFINAMRFVRLSYEPAGTENSKVSMVLVAA